MRNPWPMFFVLAITGVLCVSFPSNVVWLVVLTAVVLFLAWILLPIKFDEWFAQKINPCIQEYQRDHDFVKLENELKRWRSLALTKAAKNTIQVNQFCALLEQERWENARKTLKEINLQSKTAVEWMNYHLLMSEYAQRVRDRELEKNERQLSEEFKSKIERELNNPKLTATAKQCRTAFLRWISFAAFLFICGGIWIYLLRDSALNSVGSGAVVLSWFAFPVAVVWLVRKNREKQGEHKMT